MKGWLAIVSGHDFFYTRCTPQAKSSELDASPRGKKRQTRCLSSRPPPRALEPADRASHRSPARGPSLATRRPERAREGKLTGAASRQVKASLHLSSDRKSPEAECAVAITGPAEAERAGSAAEREQRLEKTARRRSRPPTQRAATLHGRQTRTRVATCVVQLVGKRACLREPFAGSARRALLCARARSSAIVVSQGWSTKSKHTAGKLAAACDRPARSVHAGRAALRSTRSVACNAGQWLARKPAKSAVNWANFADNAGSSWSLRQRVTAD
jgi:hypothetical protein